MTNLLTILILSQSARALGENKKTFSVSLSKESKKGIYQRTDSLGVHA